MQGERERCAGEGREKNRYATGENLPRRAKNLAPIGKMCAGSRQNLIDAGGSSGKRRAAARGAGGTLSHFSLFFLTFAGRLFLSGARTRILNSLLRVPYERMFFARPGGIRP